MAFLQISSTNPKFSFVIAKNPASGVLGKAVRQGHMFGFFTTGAEHQYNIWFRDSDTEVSYKSEFEGSFEYLNTTRYNSPMFVVNALSEMLTSAMNKRHEEDKLGFQHELTVNMMFILKPKYLEIFQQSFPDFSIVAKEIAPKNYRVTIATSRPIHDLLKFTSTFALFVTLKSNTYVDLDDELVNKHVNHVVSLDSPYFVRYVLKTNLLRSRRQVHVKDCKRPCDCPTLFFHHKPTLEKHSKQKFELKYGDTTNAREDFVRSSLNLSGNQILDIGCGEGHYVRMLAPKMAGQYLAVDIDPECITKVKTLLEKKEIENVQTFAAFGDVPNEVLKEKTDVLLIEVLEHMPLPNGSFLLREILERVNLGKLIITTPNKEFNVHFGFDDDETRHEGHFHEFSSKEFEEFMTSNVPKGYKVKFVPIGDSVDGVSMGLGAVVEVE